MAVIFQICVEGNTGSTGRIAEAIGRLAISQGWASYIAYGRNKRSSKSELIKIGSDRDVNYHVLHTRLFDRHGFGSKRATLVKAMKIYHITKAFPVEERYSLVDQISRSSRSVCANLAESWRERRYEAVFKNKITDSIQEASETQCWLEFSASCKYIEQETFTNLDNDYEQIIAMLNSMEMTSSKFC